MNGHAPLEFGKKKEWTAEAHMATAFLIATRMGSGDMMVMTEAYEGFLKM